MTKQSHGRLIFVRLEREIYSLKCRVMKTTKKGKRKTSEPYFEGILLRLNYRNKIKKKTVIW